LLLPEPTAFTATIIQYQVTTGHQRKVVHSQQNHEQRLEDASNNCRSVDIAGNIDSRERPRRRYLSSTNKGKIFFTKVDCHEEYHSKA